MITITLKLLFLIFLIFFVLHLRKDQKNWEDIHGFKPEEDKEFSIPFGWKDGNFQIIQVTYVETHLWHNVFCKLKHLLK